MKIINDANLMEFLDLIGFGNGCCGCGNGMYSIEKPFEVNIDALTKKPLPEGEGSETTKPLPLYMQGKWKQLFEGRSQPPQLDIKWIIDTEILIVLNSGTEPQAIYLSPEPFDQFRIASLSSENLSMFTLVSNEFGRMIYKYMGIEIYEVQTSEYHVRVY